jgi:hypothetical protein
MLGWKKYFAREKYGSVEFFFSLLVIWGKKIREIIFTVNSVSREKCNHARESSKSNSFLPENKSSQKAVR